jgi:hypothetical protein
MGIIDLFKRKYPRFRNENSHTLTDEDRETSAEVRRTKAEIKKVREQLELEKAQFELERQRFELKEMKDELMSMYRGVEDIGDSPDSLLQTALMTLLMKNQSQSNGTTQTQPVQEEQKTSSVPLLTKEQIKDLWEKLPKQAKKYLKNCSDEELKNLIKIHMGDIGTENTYNVIVYIREQ